MEGSGTMEFYSFKSLMELEPEEVLIFFIDELRNDSFKTTTIDSGEDKRRSANILNKMASYNCYFAEMRQMAKLTKRKAKSESAKKEIIDKALGLEEVFDTLCSFCDNQINVITKIMTLKRLELDEMDIMKYTT